MIVKVHKIHWEARWNNYGKDIDIEVIDVDCMVRKVSHPCAKWAIGEYWYAVSNWFDNKVAWVTIGDAQEMNEEELKKFLK